MRLFDYETKKVIEESDQVRANELIDAGKAIRLDLPEVESYEKKARDIYDKYNKEVERIKNSDNPIMQDEKVRKYELDRLEKEYRKQSAEIEEAYQEYRKQVLEDAKVRAAQATIDISDKDEQTAWQFATRAGLQLVSALDHEKGEAVKRIADDIRLLTDEQRTALQANASQLLANVDDVKDKRKLIDAMQEVRNPDLLALEVARQLPVELDRRQRNRDISRRVVRENEMHGTSGMTREFYEKHIKQ